MMHQQTIASKPLFLDLPSVIATTSLRESTLQKMVRESKFPKPRQLSDKRCAWLYEEVEEWARNRPVSELLPPPNTGAPKPKSTPADPPAP